MDNGGPKGQATELALSKQELAKQFAGNANDGGILTQLANNPFFTAVRVQTRGIFMITQRR